MVDIMGKKQTLDKTLGDKSDDGDFTTRGGPFVERSVWVSKELSLRQGYACLSVTIM